MPNSIHRQNGAYDSKFSAALTVRQFQSNLLILKSISYGAGFFVAALLGTCKDAAPLLAEESPLYHQSSTSVRNQDRWLGTSLLGALLLALLSACQSEPTRPVAPGSFLAQGKLALRTPADSLTVRFRWQQAGEQYDLELWGPFGQGRTRLVGDSQEMSVQDGDGRTLLSGAPAEVIRQQIGWDLPLVSMVYWAQGRASGGEPVAGASRDGEGRYLAFTQQNWQIRYLAYHAGSNRPKTMALQTGDFRIKVAFSRWQDSDG